MKNYQSFFMYIFTIIFIFGWKISPNIDLIFLFSIYLFILYIIQYNRCHIYIGEFYVIVLLILLIIQSHLTTIINGSIEVQYAFRSFRAFINFLGAIGLVGLLQIFTDKHFPDKILYYVFISISIHAILIFTMYISDPFRELIYKLTGTTKYAFVNLNTPFLSGFRIPGLTYGLAQTSVLQMFGLIIAPCIYHEFKYKTIFWVFVILLIFSILLTGRIGLIYGIIFVPLTLILISSKNKRMFLISLKFIIIFIILFFVVTKNVLPLPNKFYSYNIWWISQIFDVVRNYHDSKLIKMYLDMYFIPEDFLTFMIGRGITGRGEGGYIPSDSGYVLLLFSGGVIGMFLMISIYIIIFLYGILTFRIHKGISIVTIIVVISVMFLNAKEVALLTRNQFSVVALLACASIRLYYNSKRS